MHVIFLIVLMVKIVRPQATSVFKILTKITKLLTQRKIKGARVKFSRSTPKSLVFGVPN